MKKILVIMAVSLLFMGCKKSAKIKNVDMKRVAYFKVRDVTIRNKQIKKMEIVSVKNDNNGNFKILEIEDSFNDSFISKSNITNLKTNDLILVKSRTGINEKINKTVVNKFYKGKTVISSVYID